MAYLRTKRKLKLAVDEQDRAFNGYYSNWTICPRCGKVPVNDQSTRCRTSHLVPLVICDCCATREDYELTKLITPTPLKEWAFAKRRKKEWHISERAISAAPRLTPENGAPAARSSRRSRRRLLPPSIF